MDKFENASSTNLQTTDRGGSKNIAMWLK